MEKIANKNNNSQKSAPRALVLFSGGLDSILAARILKEQGIDVTALTFASYFFDAKLAEKSARENQINIAVRDISQKHLEIVRNPNFGRGSGMNPCIDCHLLMLQTAKKIARETGFDFLATGEVLGQRPMSQNIRALELIERKGNIEGKVLRPLSARVLPETEMEKTCMVDRGKLLGISGRSRKVQMALAKEFDIKYYPAPAGGCILTDREYSRKLRELTGKIKVLRKSDLDLLKIGRHFWVGRARIIIGRNHEENLKLKQLAEKGDILIEPKDAPGPTALVKGKRNKAVIETTENLLLKYTKKTESEIQLKIISG